MTNILFLLADQFRAGCIGATGTDPVSTPSLDLLASQSVVLPNAVSNYPVCSPHRAMLLTGQHPLRTGVTLNVNSATAPLGVGIRPGLPTWASVLRANGYRTGYIGKWHLEPPTPADAEYGQGFRDDGKCWDAYSPPDRRYGFDFWHSYGACDEHLHPHYWIGDARRDQRTDVDAWSPEHETDVAIDFISESAGRPEPFALVVSYNPPHQPFDQLPERYQHRYDNLTEAELLVRPNVDLGTAEADEAAAIARQYFSAVTALDDQIGRLLDAVDRLGLAGDTIVIFTSDHGMQLGSHGLIYKNVPYEESMALPFLLRFPGRIPPHTSPVMLDSTDLAPTLLGLTGFAQQVPGAMQGRDRSPELVGVREPDPDACAVYYHIAADPSEADQRGLRTRSEKLIATYRPDHRLALDFFDLEEDPFEQSSIPWDPRVRVLAQRLVDELARVGDEWVGTTALTALLTPMVRPEPLPQL